MTLKYMNADEIATSMANVLSDKEFQAIHKNASFNKKSEGEEALEEALRTFEEEEPALDDIEGFGEISEDEGWLDELDEAGLEEDELDEDDDLMGDAPDDREIFDTDFEGELDFSTEAAIKFTQNNLVKISNVLDKRGFSGIANIVDQTITKLSAKAKKDEECKCTCKGCEKKNGKCACSPPCKCKKCC